MRRRRYPSERRRPCPALCPELRIHAAAPSGPAPRRLATKGGQRNRRDYGGSVRQPGPKQCGFLFSRSLLDPGLDPDPQTQEAAVLGSCKGIRDVTVGHAGIADPRTVRMNKLRREENEKPLCAPVPKGLSPACLKRCHKWINKEHHPNGMGCCPWH